MDLMSFFEKIGCREDLEGRQEDAKRAAARKALSLVESGMTLGLGTGSTVEFFLQGIAERVVQGLDVSGVPTSRATEKRAQELGIPLLGAPQFPRIHTDLCVDGADRVDVEGNLVKGGGGALFREKLVALHSDHVCILVDPSKIRTVLDDSFAVPVECLPFGIDDTVSTLTELGCQPVRRKGEGGFFVTDNGNAVIDCLFPHIPDPTALALRISAVTGVVEVGLFCDLLDRLVVGFKDGSALSWPK